MKNNQKLIVVPKYILDVAARASGGLANLTQLDKLRDILSPYDVQTYLLMNEWLRYSVLGASITSDYDAIGSEVLEGRILYPKKDDERPPHISDEWLLTSMPKVITALAGCDVDDTARRKEIIQAWDKVSYKIIEITPDTLALAIDDRVEVDIAGNFALLIEEYFRILFTRAPICRVVRTTAFQTWLDSLPRPAITI